jgi:sirohydrochlorin ferrochelatase
LSAPALLAVAHGTRNPAGPETVRALLDRVRALRPWLEVAEAYAEIASPLLEDAMAGADGSVVAVPLMLGRGYHTLVDIPGRLRPPSDGCDGHVVLARPLGPHSLLGAALADRLAAGRRADAIVLGAAGSADPAGTSDVRVAARLLTRRLQRPVSYGFVAAGEPSLTAAVEQLRRRGARRVAVAAYLLAPGLFHDRMLETGADHVSAPIGAHDAVARLILRRYDEALTRARQRPRMAVAG